jgi:tape measure domain-containing protein
MTTESIKVLIEADDTASRKVERSVELTRQAMTGEERHAQMVRQYQAEFVKGNVNRETYNRLVEQSAAKNGVETEAMRQANRVKQQETQIEQRRAEFKRQVNSIVQQSITPLQAYTNQMNILERAMQKGMITSDQFAQSQARLKKSYMDRTSQGSESGSGGSMGGIVSLAGKLPGGAGGLLAGGAVAGIGLAAFESIKLAASAETAAIQFEVLTGSVKKSSDMIAAMKAMDAKTPLSFGAISQAGKTLLGYGANAESIIPTLKQLGDISMGDEERFKSLALAFGQVTAAGRLTGQEVLQMVNNGFNPLQEISKNTGISMVDLKKKMEDGEISFQMVADAIKSATGEGGRFNGMTERMATTTAGSWAKLMSEFQKSGVMIGEALNPLVSGLANAATTTMSYVNGPLKLISTGFKGLTGTMLEGFQATGALLSGDISGYLDRYAAKQREAAEAANATAEATQKQAQALSSIVELTREEQAAKDQKDTDKMFSKEQKTFADQAREIDELYQRKMLGEEKYQEMQRLKGLTAMPDNRMSDREQVAKKEALWQMEQIVNIEQLEKAKKEESAAAEKLAKEQEQTAKRIDDVKRRELDKLEEERILLTQGKEAARAFALEKQGLGKSAIDQIMAEEASVDALRGGKKTQEVQVNQAFESRMLTRAPGENENAKIAQNTAQSNKILQEIKTALTRKPSGGKKSGGISIDDDSFTMAIEGMTDF